MSVRALILYDFSNLNLSKLNKHAVAWRTDAEKMIASFMFVLLNCYLFVVVFHIVIVFLCFIFLCGILEITLSYCIFFKYSICCVLCGFIALK